MAVPILTTKLSFPPLRSKMVSRTALIEKLNQGTDCGFVLLSTPAGYGKSTLISSWLHQMNLTNTWLTLDKQDNNPIQFLTYLAAAFCKIDTAIGEVLERQLQSCPLPIIEDCLTPVLNKIHEINCPFWLILDDYHVITDQNIHQMIRFLIDHRPHNFHLVIATRADPPFPLSKYRARSEMVELRLVDLNFSVQETDEYFTQVVRLSISANDITLLQAKTEGWIVGLQMVGLSLQSHKDASRFIQSFCGEDRYILDFLFDEIFLGQSEEIQEFLLETAILEHLCASLCDVVRMQENSRLILETLERNNLFLIPLDDRREWYRYHHLFRDLLINRANQVKTKKLVLLHNRAGNWLEENHFIGRAIDHFLLAQNFEHVADIIEKHFQNIDHLNQQNSLIGWLERIPQPIIINHPWLCVFRAWGNYWSGNRGKEEEWLNLAEQSIQNSLSDQSIEKRHIQGHIAAVRAHIALLDEDIPRAKAMGEIALLLLPKDDVRRSEAAIALAGTYWAIGDVINTKRSFKLAAETALKINYTSMAAGCMGYIGIQLIKQGRSEEARVQFDEGLQLAVLQDGTETPMAGFLKIRLGDYWRERNSISLAEQYLTQGLNLCQYLNQADILFDAYICYGRFQLTIGDIDSASKFLRKAESLAQKMKIDPWVSCYLDDLKIKIWQSDSNIAAIKEWISNCGLSIDEPLSYQHDLHHQNLARAFLALALLSRTNQIEQSLFLLLDRLYFAAKQAGWLHEQIKVLIMQAISLCINKNNQTALERLAEAVTLAEPNGYQRVFIDEGSLMHALLTQLEQKIRQGEHSILQIINENANLEQVEDIQKYVRRLMSSFSNIKSPIKVQPNEYKENLQEREFLIDPLTTREKDVLKLLALGYPDKKIAEKLFITQGTVHKHLKNIYSKLDVHSRTEAVACAQTLNFLSSSH